MLGTFTLGALGAVSIYAALTRESEGYAVLLGMLFTIRSLLTLSYLKPRTDGFLARV